MPRRERTQSRLAPNGLIRRASRTERLSFNWFSGCVSASEPRAMKIELDALQIKLDTMSACPVRTIASVPTIEISPTPSRAWPLLQDHAFKGQAILIWVTQRRPPRNLASNLITASTYLSSHFREEGGERPMEEFLSPVDDEVEQAFYAACRQTRSRPARQRVSET